MAAQHTPGPWFMNLNGRDRPEVVDAHGEKIVEVFAITDKQDAVNARLIAAAPSILAELKAIRRTVASMGADLEVTAPQSVNALSYRDDIRRLDAAIAKAEGR